MGSLKMFFIPVGPMQKGTSAAIPLGNENDRHFEALRCKAIFSIRMFTSRMILFMGNQGCGPQRLSSANARAIAFYTTHADFSGTPTFSFSSRKFSIPLKRNKNKQQLIVSPWNSPTLNSMFLVLKPSC